MSKNSWFGVFTLIAISALIGINWLLSNKNETINETSTPLPPAVETTTPIPELPKNKIIGHSVEGRVIESYTYGSGDKTLLFVGGIHGGYEWNSTLLAYEFIDRLENKIITIPENITVIIIPTLNPDGLFSVVKKEGRFSIDDIPPNDAHTTGKGRLNANTVDLNRNFDCNWQPKSTWRSKTVSAGTSAFSEPEAAALRDLVLSTNPVAVVFWHSQANTVYASECKEGVLPMTLTIMNAYAKAAEYKAVPTFNAYPITGDAEGWLSSIGIPAITVELETRTSSEWEKNRSGIEALFSLYTKG